MKTLILILLMGIAFSFQTPFHYLFEKKLLEVVKPIVDAPEFPRTLKPLVIPVTGVFGHMLGDAMFNEGHLGSYQVLRGGIKLGTLILLDDPANWSEDTWIAFWSILPDLIDKGFNVNYFHRYVPERYLISCDRETEEVLEDWVVYDTVQKRFVWKKVPAGTVIAVEIPIGK